MERISHDGQTVVIDGTYTVDQLRSIINRMQHKQEIRQQEQQQERPYPVYKSNQRGGEARFDYSFSQRQSYAATDM